MNMNDGDNLTKIANLGNYFVSLNREIEDIEAELSRKKKEFNRLSTETIPEVMRNVGMTAFQLGNVFKISIKPVLVVKLDKDKVDAADSWLDKHGHSGMVKNHVEVFVPKDIDKERLEDLKRGIEALDFDYSVNKAIHYQTLNHWAREMNENGEVIPEEIFNVYRGTKTEIEGS
jgi:hypothetical protein